MQTLIIQLHSSDLSHPSWAVHDDHVIESAYKDVPDQLSKRAPGRHIIVLVPGEDVLLTYAKLPKLSKSRLQQALPYALEEQVIPEVDSLHFAPGSYSDEELAVAIVAKEKMQMWLQLLKDWNVKPDELIADYFAVPAIDGEWQMSVNETAMLRLNEIKGLVCDKNNITEICQMLLAQSTVVPDALRIHYYTKEQQKVAFNAAFAIHEEYDSPQNQIKDFAETLAKTQRINLLQAEFAFKKSKFSSNKLLHLSAGLALAWLVLLLADPLISHFILNSKVKNLDQQITAIYKKNFPNATNIIAPKLRMEEKLKHMANDTSSSRLLMLLSYVGNDLSAVEGIKIKRFDFQNNQLTLEVSAANSENFSSFTDNLQKNGLKVRQQNANVESGRINARLLIESI